MAVERERVDVCTIAQFVYHHWPPLFSPYTHALAASSNGGGGGRAAAHPSFIRKTGNYVLTGASTPLFFFPIIYSRHHRRRFPKKKTKFQTFFFVLIFYFVKFRALKKKSLFSCPHVHYLFVFMYRQSTVSSWAFSIEFNSMFTPRGEEEEALGTAHLFWTNRKETITCSWSFLSLMDILSFFLFLFTLKKNRRWMVIRFFLLPSHEKRLSEFRLLVDD